MVASDEKKTEERESVIRELREEIERLKAEISRLRRDQNERPPHYL
jgi:ribosome recycling factor